MGHLQRALYRMRVLRWEVWVPACLLLCASPLWPQQANNPSPASFPMTTDEHLETAPWWPTKATDSLQAYAGSAACVTCHREEVAVHPSGMQRAAALAGDDRFLSERSKLTYYLKPLTYTMAQGMADLDFSAAEGPHKLAQKLDFVMGAGDLGRTFLYQTDGRWFQSTLTYYTNPHALDITTGLSLPPGTHLESALGQALTPDETRRCFGCHTVHSTTSSGFNPAHAELGLGCEACHGPGLQHGLKMAKSSAGAATPSGVNPAIFNPARLSPVDSIDFCGACHRTFVEADSSLGATASTSTVRFQPYRLEESKCWRATQDERLTCVACHNPHEPLNRDISSYDRHCLQCHSPEAAHAAAPAAHPAKICPTAPNKCVTCHMPKVNVASMHGDFTDHFIRVVKPGEEFPR